MIPLELFRYGDGWGDELVSGFLVTVELSALGYLIGTLLGLAAAFGELSRHRVLAAVLQGYALTVRSVPELLVIFLFYYGGGFVLQAVLAPLSAARVEVSAFAAGLAALSLIHGAYASEVFRGAINAVPRGLIEAARSLGMAPAVTALIITVPLAVRYALPGLVNLWMVIIKTTALVSAIGVADFVRTASTAGQNTKQYFAFYLAVLLTYLLLSAMALVAQSLTARRIYRHISPIGA